MIRAILLALALAVGLASPAAAHKLKVFAAVEGDAIAGYAFFIGGGRAMGTSWTAKDADGKVLATGKTDDEGRFKLVPGEPVSSDITVTVNTHEGHIASATIVADRFGSLAKGVEPAAPAAATAAVAQVQSPGAATQATTPPAAVAGLSDSQVAVLVEAAVQRQVEPLLERIEEMDDRLRFTDILSGIFLIIGLVGIGLWVRARRN
ncbi:nickel transport protein [Breoghania corrubedonensis]|uniref:Nickel transport protein n=1 Tax=Breoghania corrubedonensis TaxID=665038 RepID=A0A2T5VGC3_9HYPH|nr:cobalamin biosynthesis protein CbiL [Breoghania corrubedonensis]PTW62809.1 nickel transport protein [Breoghania corrubedonensis]